MFGPAPGVGKRTPYKAPRGVGPRYTGPPRARRGRRSLPLRSEHSRTPGQATRGRYRSAPRRVADASAATSSAAGSGRGVRPVSRSSWRARSGQLPHPQPTGRQAGPARGTTLPFSSVRADLPRIPTSTTPDFPIGGSDGGYWGERPPARHFRRGIAFVSFNRRRRPDSCPPFDRPSRVSAKSRIQRRAAAVGGRSASM